MMGGPFRGVPGLAIRPRGIVFLVALAFMTVLWLGRHPAVCPFCDGDATVVAFAHRGIDLSRPDAPFVTWPLERVCRETKWTPGVVFVCDNNSGGIGNIRNYILTCIRYAIEAGATGLVLPNMRTRSDKGDAGSGLLERQRSFDYFFDEAHFRQSLYASCPQIAVYNSTSTIPYAAASAKIERITPRNFGKRAGCDKRDLNKHAARFGQRLHDHLESTAEQSKLPPPSIYHPRVIGLTWGAQLEFPVYRDGPEFVATFGSILRFRHDILELGLKTAAYMRQFYGVGFVGMHLRSETDNVLGRWPSIDNQTDAYLARASDMYFRSAYVATGNRTEAENLASDAMMLRGMSVVTKHDVLARGHPDDLKALEALSWDQQALVDYIVMLESEYFLGVSPSSFSINIALKRHLKMDGMYTRPWIVGGDGDGRSWILGNFEDYYADWLFMYDSIWP